MKIANDLLFNWKDTLDTITCKVNERYSEFYANVKVYKNFSQADMWVLKTHVLLELNWTLNHDLGLNRPTHFDKSIVAKGRIANYTQPKHWVNFNTKCRSSQMRNHGNTKEKAVK